MTYTITGYHGSGNGITSGGKINRVKKMGQVVIADIYLMSHVHEPINTKGIIFTPDYQHKSIVKREETDGYVREMERVFGEENVFTAQVRPTGTCKMKTE